MKCLADNPGNLEEIIIFEDVCSQQGLTGRNGYDSDR